MAKRKVPKFVSIIARLPRKYDYFDIKWKLESLRERYQSIKCKREFWAKDKWPCPLKFVFNENLDDIIAVYEVCEGPTRMYEAGPSEDGMRMEYEYYTPKYETPIDISEVSDWVIRSVKEEAKEWKVECQKKKELEKEIAELEKLLAIAKAELDETVKKEEDIEQQVLEWLEEQVANLMPATDDEIMKLIEKYDHGRWDSWEPVHIPIWKGKFGEASVSVSVGINEDDLPELSDFVRKLLKWKLMSEQ